MFFYFFAFWSFAIRFLSFSIFFFQFSFTTNGNICDILFRFKLVCPLIFVALEQFLRYMIYLDRLGLIRTSTEQNRETLFLIKIIFTHTFILYCRNSFSNSSLAILSFSSIFAPSSSKTISTSPSASSIIFKSFFSLKFNFA